METIKKLSVVYVVLCCIFLSSMFAGNNQRIGNTGAQELLIPIGARGIALGGANLMFASGSEALFWNPAGLSRMNRGVEALFSHMQYIADINVEYAALAIKAGDFGTLGFSVKSLGFGQIPVTTENFPDGTGETYSPTFVNLGATYSKLLTDQISVGVSGTVIAERIMSTSSSGIAFNFGVQYYGVGFQGLNLGITVKNIGPNMNFSGSNLLRTADATQGLRGNQFYAVQAATFQLPSIIELGVGYERKIDDKNNVLIGGNFQNNNSTDDVYGLGAEYNYDNLVALRASYLFSPQADKDPTGKDSYLYDYSFGVGLNYDFSGVGVTFDYAFRHLKFMDSNHIVTVKFGF